VKVGKPTGQRAGVAPRAKLNLDIARDIRKRIAEAKASGTGKGIENVIAAELGVHYTTIADVRDNKIWKEPKA
jgi:hypothetical protein